MVFLGGPGRWLVQGGLTPTPLRGGVGVLAHTRPTPTGQGQPECRWLP